MQCLFCHTNKSLVFYKSLLTLPHTSGMKMHASNCCPPSCFKHRHASIRSDLSNLTVSPPRKHTMQIICRYGLIERGIKEHVLDAYKNAYTDATQKAFKGLVEGSPNVTPSSPPPAASPTPSPVRCVDAQLNSIESVRRKHRLVEHSLEVCLYTASIAALDNKSTQSKRD